MLWYVWIAFAGLSGTFAKAGTVSNLIIAALPGILGCALTFGLRPSGGLFAYRASAFGTLFAALLAWAASALLKAGPQNNFATLAVGFYATPLMYQLTLLGLLITPALGLFFAWRLQVESPE